MKKILSSILRPLSSVRSALCPLSSVLCLFAGCAALQPGADPLIVRAEQTEAIAKVTLDTFERIDNANRTFFATNAPALHNFAEYLRQSVVVNGTNYLPRGLAFVVALDTTKRAYKQGKASSNVVVTAIAVLDTAIHQAESFIAQQQPMAR